MTLPEAIASLKKWIDADPANFYVLLWRMWVSLIALDAVIKSSGVNR